MTTNALDLADHILGALPELRFHPTAKRIRASLDGASVIDSSRAVLVWEPRRIVPSDAVPIEDIAGSLIEAEATRAEERVVELDDGPPFLDPSTAFPFHTAPGRSFDIAIDGDTASTVPAAAAFAPAAPNLNRTVILDFDAFDQWREEDVICFFNERVDISLDGQPVDRPWTPWS